MKKMYVQSLADFIKKEYNMKDFDSIIVEAGDEIILKPYPTMKDELEAALFDVNTTELNSLQKKRIKEVLNGDEIPFYQIMSSNDSRMLVFTIKYYVETIQTLVWDVTIKAWVDFDNVDLD